MCLLFDEFGPERGREMLEREVRKCAREEIEKYMGNNGNKNEREDEVATFRIDNPGRSCIPSERDLIASLCREESKKVVDDDFKKFREQFEKELESLKSQDYSAFLWMMLLLIFLFMGEKPSCGSTQYWQGKYDALKELLDAERESDVE